MFLIVGLFLISMVSAITTLGTFKQNSNINLIQNCENSTYSNVSLVVLPNSNFAINTNTTMTKVGDNYNLSFNNTNAIGVYTVFGYCDEERLYTTWAYTFEVTPSGFIGTLGFYIVLLIIIAGVIIMGFTIKEAWFVMMGGMALLMLGIYSINYGIVGFRDMFMTWGVGLFEIGIGTTLIVGAGLEKIEE